MHALRLGHLHRGGCSRATRQRRDTLGGLSRARPTSSAYSSLLAVTSPWLSMSCSLKMRSNPSVKHCWLKISIWMTPRWTGNCSEHSVSPLGRRRRTIPVAFTMRRILGCTPAAARDSSRKRWLVMSKAAR